MPSYSKYAIQASTLTSIADAIREKGVHAVDPSQVLYPNNMAWNIRSLKTHIPIEEYYGSNFQSLDSRIYETNAILPMAFQSAYGLPSALTFSCCSFIGDYAFEDVNDIQTFNASKCTYIGKYAFYGCSNLSSVILSRSMKFHGLGEGAFQGCSILSIDWNLFEHNQTSIPAKFYCGGYAGSQLIYSSQRLGIGSYAFANCPNLELVSFRMNNTIGERAFWSNQKLRSATFSILSDVGVEAFSECHSLQYFAITDSRWNGWISDRAFYNCNMLESVYIPYKEVSIANSVFDRDFFLSDVNIPHCKAIGEYAFNSCTALSSISFPECSEIGASAFRCCSVLTSVYLPLCERIGDYAFCSCWGLSYLELPEVYCLGDSYNGIGSYCFSGTALGSLSLPGVETIRGYAFQSCYGLFNLYLLYSGHVVRNDFKDPNGVAVSDFLAGTYFSNGRGIIWVPSALYSDYMASNAWSLYWSVIRPYDL